MEVQDVLMEEVEMAKVKDPYWRVVLKNLDDIAMLYGEFEERKPVMLYDIQERRVYAYPYSEYRKELSQRSQALLEEQYRDCLRSRGMVVFVRDNKRRKLVSYTVERA